MRKKSSNQIKRWLFEPIESNVLISFPRKENSLEDKKVDVQKWDQIIQSFLNLSKISYKSIEAYSDPHLESNCVSALKLFENGSNPFSLNCLPKESIISTAKVLTLCVRLIFDDWTKSVITADPKIEEKDKNGYHILKLYQLW